jgi:hypothetical protein
MSERAPADCMHHATIRAGLWVLPTLSPVPRERSRGPAHFFGRRKTSSPSTPERRMKSIRNRFRDDAPVINAVCLSAAVIFGVLYGVFTL